MKNLQKISNRLKYLILILVLSIIIFLCDFLFFNNPTVTINDNIIIKSNYDFIYEHWKEPALFTLYKNENYKNIKYENEFDLFKKLCNWTYNQWEQGIPDPYPLSNALDILYKIRNNITKGFCGQYSYVYVDVLKSLGFFSARYVELWNYKGSSHFVVEVWSNRFNKWILIDPSKNIYYKLRNTGVPANAYQIRQSLFTENKVDLVFINEKYDIDIDKEIEYYRNFAVSLRSDLMRHKLPLTIKDRFDMFLFYKDKNTNKFYNNKIPYRNVTSSIDDIYFDCNKTKIKYKVGSNFIDFWFFTESSTPNFKNFIIKFNNNPKWFSVPSKIRVYKKDNINVINVAVLNQLNQKGVINKIEINW